MKLWTRNSSIFVLDRNGLSIREKDAVIQVSTLGLAHGFVRGKLAVSPDGRYVAFGADDSDVTLCDLTRTYCSKLAKTENLLWLSPSRVLAVMKDQGLGLFHFSADQDGSDCFSRDRTIDTRMVRSVEWPTSGEKGSVWSELPSAGPAQKIAWELSIGSYGAVAVEQATGLVVLLSPDSWEVCTVLRVPAEYPETVIYASALFNSVAVTHTGGRSIGGTNVFDYGGRWIAGIEAHGLPSPADLMSRDVLVQLVEESQFTSSLILRMMNSRTLNVLRTVPTELDALNGYPTLHVGKSQIVMGDGGSYQVKDLASLEVPP
jgi:hypothetical protein